MAVNNTVLLLLVVMSSLAVKAVMPVNLEEAKKVAEAINLQTNEVAKKQREVNNLLDRIVDSG